MSYLSNSERAALDEMIAAAKTKTHKVVTMGKTLEHIHAPEGGLIPVWVYTWRVDGLLGGLIAVCPYGAEWEIANATFQAECARYFADGVQAKKVIIHGPHGKEERLR